MNDITPTADTSASAPANPADADGKINRTPRTVGELRENMNTDYNRGVEAATFINKNGPSKIACGALGEASHFFNQEAAMMHVIIPKIMPEPKQDDAHRMIIVKKELFEQQTNGAAGQYTTLAHGFKPPGQ